MIRFPAILVVALLAVSACDREPTETYGLVATLGNDTTSIERITRSRTHVVADAVGRSPIVTRRHWEADLDPDGTVRRWSMETFIPSAPVTERALRHTASFGDTIRLTRRAAGVTRSFAYLKRYPVTVPWNAFVYGTYELLLNAAKRLPDRTPVGQYFFEGWDESHVGYAEIVKTAGGDYSLSSTGLAGSGLARLDSAGHLLSYSGQGTTYKQEVRRITDVPDLDAIATRFAADEAAKGVQRSLSPRDTVRATVGGADIILDYSRPARRGRVLVGDVIPYDRIWRTGANAATQLTVSRPVQVAGIPLDSGRYTLWTLPTRRGVLLIVNGESGQWGTTYHLERDVGRAPLTVDSLATNQERFTIRVEPDSTQSPATGRLVMEWGTFRWSAPIAVKRRQPGADSQ